MYHIVNYITSFPSQKVVWWLQNFLADEMFKRKARRESLVMILRFVTSLPCHCHHTYTVGQSASSGSIFTSQNVLQPPY
jgi:hypothetical protein